MERSITILLPSQSSTRERNTPTINEANSSGVDRYAPEIEALHSLLGSDDFNNSSSIQSSSCDEVTEKRYKRKLSIYQEMQDNKRNKHNPESSKKKAENIPNDNCNRQMLLRNSIDIIEYSFQRAMDEGKMQGYVYGIILQDGSVISGSSASLRKWWEETVRFKDSATVAIEWYCMKKEFNLELNKETDAPWRNCDVILVLSDATLASVLSALMNSCDPPQRKFPFEKKVPPPWWPTGNEPWWDQIAIEKDQGLPPYRKPHDLRKVWKAAVVIAIIKHMAPAFDKLARVVKQSKILQDRMSAKEMQAWNYVLNEEVKMYSLEHPYATLSDLPGQFLSHGSVISGNSNSSTSPEQQEPILPPPQQPHQQQVALVPFLPTEPRLVRYTCDHPRCLHHNIEFGFHTVELWGQHLQSCGFRYSTGQFGSQVEHLQYPTNTLHQIIIPTQFTPQRQAPNSSFQQMVPPPRVLQRPMSSYQEVPGAFSFNNACVSNYSAMPNDSQDKGPLQSSILGNARSFM